MVVDVSGAVLAGGRGVRLGTDKALLRLGGETLLARVVGRLAAVTDEVLVIGRDNIDSVLPARAVADERPGAGSLGGIYTALRVAGTSRCLVVACDMPFLNPALLKYLIGLSADFDVVIPRLGKLLEPVHAVYAKSCLGPIEALLATENLRILDFFDQVRIRYVEHEEVVAFDPRLMSFFNVNTPEQWERARALVRQMEGYTDD
ncbi:MAG: molybdenum cofactor guanylyltransferase [Chloroflexota bacterium]